LSSFGLNPLAYIADNASNCVLANDELADWSNAISGYQDRGDEEDECIVDNVDSEHREEEESQFNEKVREAFQLPTEAVGCHAHLINLIINDAMKLIEEDINSMQRFVNKFRKHSTTRDFVAKFSPDHVPYFRSTVTTRWKYAYSFHFSPLCIVFLMFLIRFFLMGDIIKQEKVLYLALTAHRELPSKFAVPGLDSVEFFMSSRKMSAFKSICSVLTPICAMIDMLEGDSYPTMSLVQTLACAAEKASTVILTREHDKDHPSDTVIKFVESVINGVQHRLLYKPLNEYNGYIPVDYIAAALDPRTKTMAHLPKPDREILWNHINKLVVNLQAQSVSLQSKEVYPNVSNQEFGSAFEILHDSPQKPQATRRMRVPLIANELSEYKACTPCQMEQNALEWWKFNEKLYPHVAQLAKDYLALPASSATVERLFSRAGSVRLLSIFF
jgi:hypothetical protein